MRIKNALSLIDQEIKFRVEYTNGLGGYLDEMGIKYEFYQQNGNVEYFTICFPKQSTELLAINLWNLAMKFNQWKQCNNVDNFPKGYIW